MSKSKFSHLFVILISILLIPASAYTINKPEPDKTAIMAKAAKLRIPFIENQGQVKDKTVKFYANTFAGNVYITEKGDIVYSLPKMENKDENPKIGKEKPKKVINKVALLRERLVGAKTVKVQAKDKAITKVNYFTGNDKSKWKSNIPTYDEVSLGEVYNGIELKLKAYGKNVEKLFTVNPEGKVEDIKLRLQGARGIEINKEGELEVETDLGNVKFRKPYAYQEIDGKRVEVGCEFKVSSLKSQFENSKSENKTDLQAISHEPQATVYGFTLASYNSDYPLIIDPLLASTFIGSTNWDEARAITINNTGDVFVAGYTGSSDYPTTSGAYDTSHNGGNDVFVSRLDSSLSTLIASTFIGGSGSDVANAIAINSTGDVFVTGHTVSSDYPTTSGAYDTSHAEDNGGDDVFISRLDSSLSTLIASTFIGGNAIEYANAIAINSAGDVFVTGGTGSSDYPTTSGAYDTSHDSSSDVFVSKFDNNLSNLLASTFIGGNHQDWTFDIAIDSSGDIFLTGVTWSSDYPTTPGAYDTSFEYIEGFVSRFDSSLSTLIASTFIGGSDLDDARAIAISSSGDIFVAGYTASSDYPTTSGAYDTSFNGFVDVFVSRLDSSLSTLIASTFIGGSGGDWNLASAISSSGVVFVIGYTASSDYPTTPGAYDTSFNGFDDVFVSRLDSSLSTLIASTFIGGSGYERANAIAINSTGDVFIAGYTGSSDYPTTSGAYDTSHDSSSDVFVSRLDGNLGLIPKTGQTKCYDEAGTEIACTGTGQDGEIQAGVAWPSPRFQDNIDGTITDNLTGLMWAKDANIMASRDPSFDTDGIAGDGRVYWQHALDYVKKLNDESYLGYTDWYLPNVNQLESLVNADEPNQATWLNAQGFTNVQSGSYWSSSTYTFDTNNAWSVSYNGDMDEFSKNGFNYSVWPVRDGQLGTVQLPKTGQTTSYAEGDDGDLEKGVAWPIPRFTDNGDETVTDNLTGLMWTKNADLPNGYMYWQDALNYIASLNSGAGLGGYHDWRLANRKELRSLADYSNYGTVLPTGHPFTNVKSIHYWSSSTEADLTIYAWIVSMWNGSVDFGYKSVLVGYVWPVRGGATTIDIAEEEGPPGSIVEVPVTLTTIGSDIISFDLEIGWDCGSILSYDSVVNGSSLPPGWIITPNPEANKIGLSMFGTTPVSNGEIVKIKFNIDPSAPVDTVCNLSWNKAEGNEIPIPNQLPGSVTVTGCYGDVSCNGIISSYDAALCAHTAVGLPWPIPYPSCVDTPEKLLKICDVSGNLEISSYDAALIARCAVGLGCEFPVGAPICTP